MEDRHSYIEDRLKYIYENSTKILDLIKKGKITCSDLRKMIFNSNISLKLKTDSYNGSHADADSFDQYLNSGRLINLLLDSTIIGRKKEILGDIECLFHNYYLVKEGEIIMDTKQLLLEKFIYLFNNSEVITDFMDLSACNLTSNSFRTPQLEALLLDYKFLSEDENCNKVETYKRLSDNVNSYDITHKISLTKIILDRIVNYIKSQKRDVVNRNKKLEIMTKYYQLLNYVKTQVGQKTLGSDRKKEDSISLEKVKIKKKFIPNMSILSHMSFVNKNYRLTPPVCKSSILRDVNDIGVENNNFINNNIVSSIKTNDEMMVLEAIQKEKQYVKMLRCNQY